MDSAPPDVVLLDLNDTHASTHLAMAITASYPAVTIIACSSAEPRMRVFPLRQNGESYVARMSPEALVDAIRHS